MKAILEQEQWKVWLQFVFGSFRCAWELGEWKTLLQQDNAV
jgi:hypothetical protein